VALWNAAKTPVCYGALFIHFLTANIVSNGAYTAMKRGPTSLVAAYPVVNGCDQLVQLIRGPVNESESHINS
jgi:hypothetical protein